MAVILVRHTRPAAEEGLCYGRLDLDVAESFEREAAAVLAELPSFDRIVSSPLKRCRRLAGYVARARNLPVEVDENLSEMDFGDWEGQIWDEIGPEKMDHWVADFLHFRGHGGESVAQFENRVRAALAPYVECEETVLVVCHAGVIRSALTPDCDDPEKWNHPVPFGSVHRLEPEGC